MLEEAGYRRGGGRLRYGRGLIKDLTRAYALRVLQHRRNRDGGLALEYHGAAARAALSWEEHWRKKLLRQKYPAHLVEGKVREALAALETQKRPGG